ncbi:MAG: hypothetical protein QOJ76_2645 [Acidobacteriota bacterium]|jgi:hypothetical protein|nr:hypothetical protein [Acidobacteriota bacterium]
MAASKKLARRKTTAAAAAARDTGVGAGVGDTKPLAVTLGATFNINGKDVTINTGDINKIREQGFIFVLTEPVTLFTLTQFIDWLKGSPLNLPIPTIDWNSLPEAFRDIQNLTVTITVFRINTKEATYALGVTFSLPNGFAILPNVTFKSFAFLAGNDITLPPVPAGT